MKSNTPLTDRFADPFAAAQVGYIPQEDWHNVIQGFFIDEEHEAALDADGEWKNHIDATVDVYETLHGFDCDADQDVLRLMDKLRAQDIDFRWGYNPYYGYIIKEV
jgi:hypothetical protein